MQTQGFSAMHLAVLENDLDAVKYLLAHDVNPLNPGGTSQKTLLQIAEENHYEDMQELLKDEIANILQSSIVASPVVASEAKSGEHETGMSPSSRA